MVNLTLGLKALIWHNGKILLLKRSDLYAGHEGECDLPGGRLVHGEDPEDALRREVMEETGLEIEIICPLDAATRNLDNDSQTIRITYLCTSGSSDIALSPEHSGYEWIAVPNQAGQIPCDIDDPVLLRALARFIDLRNANPLDSLDCAHEFSARENQSQLLL